MWSHVVTKDEQKITGAILEVTIAAKLYNTNCMISK